MAKIEDLRVDIDKLDAQIMKLLNERFHITTQIGEIKKLNNTNVLDQNREKIIYDKTSKFSHYPLIKEVYRTIMEQSKNQQRK